jgi:D-aspartate ligase
MDSSLTLNKAALSEVAQEASARPALPSPGIGNGSPHRQVSDVTGALVIGGDYRALTVVRSLGRRGIPVWVLPEQQKIAAKSRYAIQQHPLPKTGGDAQIAFLLSLAEKHHLNGWVVLPTEDKHAALIARHQGLLSRRFKLATSRWETVEVAYDKRATYRAAIEHGVDHPKTFYPRDRHEIESLDFAYPVILKPAIKDEINRFTRAKAWRVENRGELLARYDEACSLLDPELVMIQELIPGGGEAQFSYGALCENGRPLASIVARRTRQYPVDFGRSSSFVETVDCPEVEEAGRRLLMGLDYTGLMEVEFKYDRRDGRFKMIDLNPRVWGWHTLAALGGVDFPYFFWRLVLHLPVPEIRVKAGYRWVRMTTDLPAAMREIRSGSLSVGSYVHSLRSPLGHSVFAADDPLPFLLEVPLLSIARSAMWLRELSGARRNGSRRRQNATPASDQVSPIAG